MIKTLQISAVDLWLLEQDHLLTRKKNKTKKTWHSESKLNNLLKFFIKILLVTNFPFKSGLEYEIKQLNKEILQFTKVFATYFIFKNSRM